MNHYDCLKVTPDAPTEVIRAAYRALAGKLHPDRQGGTMGRDDGTHDQMAALNTAYEVLVDPGQRADYDASLIARATAIDEAAGPSSAYGSAERDHGFAETRVDVDWMTPKVLGTASPWPPTRSMVYLGAAGLLLVIAFTVWVTWQVLSRHQMERALSDQYSANPPRPMTAEEADEPMMPTPELRTPSLEAVASKRLPSSEERHAPADRQPTVEELSRMSDEQLLAVLPTLGDNGSFAAGVPPRRPSVIHHPLDGKPLNLRTDPSLVDPLAEEPPAKSAR